MGRTDILIKANLVEIHRVRPRTRVPYISGLHIETTRPDAVIFLWPVTLEACGEDVEYAIVIPQSGGPHATTRLGGLNLELAGTGEGMADQIPLDKVCAVVDGGTGEVFERGGDEEEVIPDADNRGVGIESR